MLVFDLTNSASLPFGGHDFVAAAVFALSPVVVLSFVAAVVAAAAADPP